MNIYSFISNFNFSGGDFEFTTPVMEMEKIQFGEIEIQHLNIIPSITSILKNDDGIYNIDGLTLDDLLIYNMAKNNIKFTINYNKNENKTQIKKMWVSTNKIYNESHLKWIIPFISKIANFFNIDTYTISYEQNQYEFCLNEK